MRVRMKHESQQTEPCRAISFVALLVFESQKNPFNRMLDILCGKGPQDSQAIQNTQV